MRPIFEQTFVRLSRPRRDEDAPQAAPAVRCTEGHPASALLLSATPPPVTALTVGTVAPDLPDYLPFSEGMRTYEAVGVVPVDVVLRSVAWLVWHGLLARPVRGDAGRVEVGGLRRPATGDEASGGRASGTAASLRLRARWRPGPARRSGPARTAPEACSLRRLGLVLVALAVGAVTHVVRDELTHRDRWGAEHVTVLAAEWGGVPGYRWLQHGSGLTVQRSWPHG